MADNKIFAKARFKLRSNPQQVWEEKNPVLLDGEPGIVSDGSIEKIKFGDGVTEWNNLPYFKGEKGDKGDRGEPALTDSEYNPESENAQSGRAVAQAIEETVGNIDAVLSTVVAGGVS